LTTEIQRRYVKEYRMIDSVGGMWVGSLDEMSDEIKTGPPTESIMRYSFTYRRCISVVNTVENVFHRLLGLVPDNK
jgi:hypothetical protein